MALLTTAELPPLTITVTCDPPEACPVCRGPMTGVELQISGRATTGPAAGNIAPLGMSVHRSVATALPCRCNIHDRTEPKKPPPVPQFVEGEPVPKPPEDAPRSWHEWHAKTRGYFWLPCPSCGEEFGGHEWLPWTGEFENTIPDPDEPDVSTGTGICPACTRAGRGNQAWAASGLRYNTATLPRLLAKVEGDSDG